jgi:hypothetical protein
MNKGRNYLTMVTIVTHDRKMTLSAKRILVPKSNLSLVLPKRPLI